MTDGKTLHFFERGAPPADLPGRMLETVMQALGRQRHVICTVPLNVTPASLYGFVGMMTSGLCVVVCPDREQIQRSIGYFAQGGFDFPTVAVLDGHQMPHMERDVHQHAKHHRVRLLFTTPDEFDTLAMMELMVHSNLTAVIVEQANLLLPDHSRAHRYLKLKQGLERFRKLPTLMLLMPPTPPAALERLRHTMNLEQAEIFSRPPLWRKTQVNVHRLTTSHQKFKRLVTLLLAGEHDTRTQTIAKMFDPDSTLIRVRELAECDKLLRSLTHYGFQKVYTHHARQTPEERRKIQDAFAQRQGLIVIHCGQETGLFRGPLGELFRVIDWQMPQTTEELMAEWFRMSPTQPHLQEAGIEGHLLYTKEDFQRHWGYLTWLWQENPIMLAETHQGLLRLRQWIQSKSCRIQTLMAYLNGMSPEDTQPTDDLPPPCGYCDRCTEAKLPSPHRLARTLIDRFLS